MEEIKKEVEVLQKKIEELLKRKLTDVEGLVIRYAFDEGRFYGRKKVMEQYMDGYFD